jgi:2-succinyl-6-hydroxy-2,4-cyclohexadiene-1-carboxylate synthase
MELPVQTSGDPNAPPVVLLHGFLGTASDWQDLANDLADDYYAIMPDLPGHGRNIPIQQRISLDHVVATVLELVSKLNAPPVLIGYSMGGRIALSTAVSSPRSFAGLILEGANPGLAGEKDRLERARLDDQRARQLEDQGLTVFVQNWYQAELFQSLDSNPARKAQLIEQRRTGSARDLAAVLRTFSVGRQPNYRPKLSGIKLPVLLIAGEYDRKYTEINAEISALSPQAESVMIQAAGHNCHFEQPEAYAKVVRDFLVRVFGSSK